MDLFGNRPLEIKLHWIELDCMSKVLSLPHTKYNNRFIKVKCTGTPRQFLDQSVTVANPGRHWSLVLTSSVR